MSRKATVIVLCAATGLLVALLLPTGAALSQGVRDGIQQVFVTNFPTLQRVDGEVAVRGPVRLATSVAIKDIVVPPVSPKDTQRLIQAGTITTEGFSHVVLSLSGQIRGEIVRPGSVGAILIPDEDTITKAFDERGEMLFALQVTASSLTGASPYFASDQPRLPVGFPRYRVLLFNTSQKSVSVNLFAYLSS